MLNGNCAAQGPCRHIPAGQGLVPMLRDVLRHLISRRRDRGPAATDERARTAGPPGPVVRAPPASRARPEHRGSDSWIDVHTRRTGRQRPVADTGDDLIVVAACASTPPSADACAGGTVWQAHLSASPHHRWHAPATGTVVRFVVERTCCSEADRPGAGWWPGWPWGCRTCPRASSPTASPRRPPGRGREPGRVASDGPRHRLVLEPRRGGRHRTGASAPPRPHAPDAPLVRSRTATTR